MKKLVSVLMCAMLLIGPMTVMLGDAEGISGTAPGPNVPVGDDVIYDAVGNDLILQVEGGVNMQIMEDGFEVYNNALANINSVTINGNALDNTLTIALSSGNPIPDGGLVFDGKLAGTDFDTMEFTGGSVDGFNHYSTNANDGTVELDMGGSTYTISYMNLEPISSTINAVDVLLTYGPNNEVLTVSNFSPTETTVDSTAGESTTFVSPTNMLTLDTTDISNDLIRFDGLAGNFVATTGEIFLDTSAIDFMDITPRVLAFPSFTIDGGATIVYDIDGNTYATNYDSIDVTGTVTLTNAQLELTFGYSPTSSDSYTIITNDGADAVVGTFSGLAEGACWVDGSQWFQISYVGGDGNDVVVTAIDMDFGDVIDIVAVNYPTLLASDGARHVVGSLNLGASIDGEPDGQPSIGADGDDLNGLDDEDGVMFPDPMTHGEAVVLPIACSGAGFVNGWIDFNGDGDWDDAGEQIFTDTAVVPGFSDLNFNVPFGAIIGNTFARIRLNSVGGLTISGLAMDGEVEDYRVTIIANSPPTANNDNYTTGENSILNVAEPAGVLDNDTDPDVFDTISVVEMNALPGAIGNPTLIPSGAMVTMEANGSFVYNPGMVFNSLNHTEFFVDDFNYTISDGNGNYDNATVFINVTGENDAPQMADAGNPDYAFADIVVDWPGTASETLVSTITGATITDVDTNSPAPGIVVVWSSGVGTWQYNIGSGWTDFGSVSDPQALALRDIDMVRYVPDGSTVETAGFAYRAWDRSSGTAGTKLNANFPGGTSPFSVTQNTAEIDVLDMPDLTVGDASATEGNTLEFDVQLSFATIQDVWLEMATTGGSATDGVDYENTNFQYSMDGGGSWIPCVAGNQSVIEQGNTSILIEVDSIQDTLLEGNELFTLRINSVISGSVGDSSDTGQGTINDDDAASLQWDITGDATVVEGNIAAYSVSYSGVTIAVGQSATIHVDTGSGVTPVPDATPGIDYNPVSNTLTFIGGGPTSINVNVQTITDAIIEGNEEYGVMLSNPSIGAINVSRVDTVIIDNSAGSLQWDITGDATVAEGNIAAYTVSYSGATLTPGQTAIIDVDTGPGLTIVPDAIEGVDYNSADGILTFNGGGPASQIVNVQTNVDALFEGDEEYTVSISGASVGTINIDVVNTIIQDANTNTPPTATDNLNWLYEDDVAPASGNVITDDDGFGVDSDPDTVFTLTVSEIDGENNPGNDIIGSYGTLEWDYDGSYDYYVDNGNAAVQALAVGESLNDIFTYTLSDGYGGTDTATLNITINGTNDPVNAVDDGGPGFITDEDSSFDTASVLTNDTDVDTNDVLSVSALDTTGTIGLVIDNTDGTFNYDPNGQFEYLAAGEQTLDFFNYTVTDGVTFDTAMVVIIITGVNDAPTAADDSGAGYVTDEDSTFDTANVTLNDNDPDPSDVLTVSNLDTTGTIGSVMDNGDGTFNYDPNGQFDYLAQGEVAYDFFNYTVSDGSGGFDTAMVNITINGVNDPPVAVDDGGPGFVTDEDNAFTTASVLTNDTDADTSDVLSVSGFDTTGTIGAVINNGDGTFDYDPNGQFEYLAAGEIAYDFFNYTVTDSNGGFDTAMVTIIITGVNDAPTATDDGPVVIDEDSGANAIDVLVNDNDPDTTDTLLVTIVTQGGNGTVVIAGGGIGLTYEPDADYFGPDTFTYTVSDGHGGTDTATVTITVNNVADAPDAVNDDATVNEDSGANTISVLDNDDDVDGDAVTIIAAADGTHGTVIITNGGLDLTYEPDADYYGTDTFTYTISDGGLNDTATVTVTIVNVNDNPTAVPDTFTIDEDSDASQIYVLANDIVAPDSGETLSISSVSQPAHGTVVITGGGIALTYEPDANYFGADTFTYTISDGNGGTAIGRVDVTVNNVNDQPVLSGVDRTSAEEGDVYAVTYMVADIDTGDTLTWSIVSDASWLNIGAANGTLYGIAEPGRFSVRVLVSDGNGGSDFREFDLTVSRLDTDNDGVPDDIDTFPNDANETADADEDGIGDNADTDDDNDGTPDTEDDFPLDATESIDTDNDGIGNNADNDDDGDGVADIDDPAPLDSSIRTETDESWPFWWVIYLIAIVAVLGIGVLLFIRWFSQR